jgi:hypothetical protein
MVVTSRFADFISVWPLSINAFRLTVSSYDYSGTTFDSILLCKCIALNFR